MVARGVEEHASLDELLTRGKKNGVQGLKILDQEEVCKANAIFFLLIVYGRSSPHFFECLLYVYILHEY